VSQSPSKELLFGRSTLQASLDLLQSNRAELFNFAANPVLGDADVRACKCCAYRGRNRVIVTLLDLNFHNCFLKRAHIFSAETYFFSSPLAK
jgi:hypothetical protein